MDSNMPAEEALRSETSKGVRSASQEGSFDLPELIPIGKINSGRNQEMPSLGDPELPVEKPKPAEPVQDTVIATVEEVTESTVQKVEDSIGAVVSQNSDKIITLEKLVREATEESPTQMDTNNTDVLITLTETNSKKNSVIESDKQNVSDNNTVPEEVVVGLTECIEEEGTVDQNDSGNTLEGESAVAPNDGISAEEPAKEASPIEEVPPKTPVEEMPAETPVGETSVKTPVEEVAVKASIEEVASKVASEEETNQTSIEKETNKTSIEEVSIEAPNEEVSVETPVEEIIVDEAPTEVPVEETPIEVSVEQTPMQVSVDETPIEISVNETTVDLTGDETPADVTVDETPADVTIEETPVEVAVEMLVEEQPQPVTTDIEDHVLVENDETFPMEQLEDKASENAYVVEADTSNEMDDVEYHVVINDTETVSVNGMPQLTKQDIGVYETEVAIKTDEECSFEKQEVHDVTISSSEVQNPETSAIISLTSDTITEVTLSDVQVLETQEGLVTLSELNEQSQQEVVILQDESMLLMDAEEYDQPESIEVTSQEEHELEEGDSKVKIPCHVLGRNIENPLEDPVRNGRLLMKPRLGVKIPYRNLTSQIVSKQDIANEIMERSRIRQASAEPPAGGDVFFAKKLTQRLARKLTSPEKTIPKSATKTSSASSASSSKRLITSSSQQHVASSKSPQASSKQQTVTVASSKVHASPVVTPKSNNSSSKPPIHVKASDKITDNSDLIALLEGDDDTDWTTVCPKKNDLSNSNKTDSSKKSDKLLSKKPSDWERETALKQLRELPLKSSKDYVKSSSSSKISELLPPKQIIKEFKEPIKSEQSVESSPPKDPLDELKDDLNAEPRFSSSLVMKTYTRKRKTSEDIMKPILASATIIHPPKKMMILGEPKASSTVQKQSSATLHKQVAASQKQIPTSQKQASASQKQATPQKPTATSQKSTTTSQKSTTTSQKPAATPQKPAATPQKPTVVLQRQVLTPQKPTSQKQTASPAPKHPSSTPQKSSSQKPSSTPSTPKPTATPSGQKSVQKSLSSSNISKPSSTVSKAASTPNIPKASANSTQKATATPVQKTPVIEKKAVTANEKKRPVTPTKPAEPVVVKKTLSPNTYISKSSRIVKRKKIWDPDEATPMFKVSPALKSPKSQEVSPEKTAEKKAGKQGAGKPSIEKATPKSNEKLDGSTPKTAEKKMIKSVAVLKPSSEKSTKKVIVKKVLKKKIRPKRLTEVDRLLMDEGAVNLLYSVKNTEELQNLRKKKKKTVISIDRAQRELLNKTNEIKNDLQINSTKDSPISLRKKEGGTPKASPVKIELAATILQRKKSKDSITGSVHSPPASPAYAYSQHAEASRIIRRHSSSSFSSEESDEEEGETNTEKSTKQKTAAAESPKKKQKIAHEKQGKAAPAVADKQQVKEEISKTTSKASPDDPKYSQFETFNVRKFDNLVQLILAPTSSNGQTTLTLQVLTELITILDLLQKDNTCRVVLFSSSGNSFCQGIDYKDLACDDQKQCQSVAEQYAASIREFLTALTKFPKILVAGVHGNTVGIGVTMLPLFDMVLASDTATFSTPYAQLGCAAEGGVLLTLPHVMHNALASELFFASRKLTAAEALRLGLVTRTLWPDKFQEELIAALKIISGQSLQSMQAIKKQLRQHLLQNVESSLKSESATLIRHWVSNECQSNFNSYSVESK